MKKIIVVLFLVVVCSTLFASSYFQTSLGFGFFSAHETVSYGGVSISGNEKTSTLTSDLTGLVFAENSTLGLDVGLTILFPLSASVNGVDVEIGFFDCNWCPRVGVAYRYDINKQLTMFTSAGYEMMMGFSSTYQSGITIHSSLFVHGIYAQDRFSYKVSDTMNVNAGLSLYIPLFGSQKLSAAGYASERYSYVYSGILINPFIGVNIKR